MGLYTNADTISGCKQFCDIWKWMHVLIAFFLVFLLWSVTPCQCAPEYNCSTVICFYMFLQPVMCGIWALWRWSPWRGSRQCRKPQVWLWAPTPYQRLLWSTSRCPPRVSPSLTTRGSECNARTHTNIIHTCKDTILTITVTLSLFRLFFRRHYNVNTVIFCALDPQDRKWVLLISRKERFNVLNKL